MVIPVDVSVPTVNGKVAASHTNPPFLFLELFLTTTAIQVDPAGNGHSFPDHALLASNGT